MDIKLLVYLLSTGLAAAQCMTVWHGMQLTKRETCYACGGLAAHKRWAAISGILIALIIAVVEGMVVPHFKRHYTSLLVVHLCLCALFLSFYVSALIFNGLRKGRSTRSGLRHRILGRLSWAFSILVVITGDIVTARAHL